LLKKLEFESDFFNLFYAEANSIYLKDKDLSAYDVGQVETTSVIPIKELETTAFTYEDSKLIFTKKIKNKDQTVKYSIQQAIELNINEISDELIFPLVEYSRFLSITDSEYCLHFYQLWAKKAILGTFDNEAYIIKLDTKVVAFISVRYEKENAHIENGSIHKDYQGKGLASELLLFLEQNLYAKGFKNLSVATEGKNIPAINFYNKNDFKLIDTKYWYYWRK